MQELFRLLEGSLPLTDNNHHISRVCIISKPHVEVMEPTTKWFLVIEGNLEG